VKLDFVAQPYAEDESLYTLLREWLASADFDRLTAITAWATFGGIARVQDALEAFKARRGSCRAIVGVDEDGATEQGLRLAAELFDEAFVFYSGDGRTFHPKVYFLRGASRAVAFVGSNNLTPGGSYFNFEAAVGVDLDLSPNNPGDLDFLEQLEQYAAGLIGDADVCRDLKTDLEAILRDKRITIRDERQRRPGRGVDASDGVAPSEHETGADGVTSIFGRSRRRMAPHVPLPRPIPPATVIVTAPPGPMPPGPTPPGPTPPGPTPPGPTPPGPTPPGPTPPGPTPPGPTPAGPTPSPVIKRWHRPLDATGAQQPLQVGSNPTGNLRLAQAGHPLDQKTYFRQSFFGSVRWTSQPNTRGVLEECDVPFGVMVGGANLGTLTMRVSHADYRIAAQNNVPTVLHWGPLMATLVATSYVGQTVTLELRANGTFALTIQPMPTGTFIP
jgi:hypothetical protein